MNNFPQAATIATTDSGGGAGIEADIKTMEACKTFSTNVVVGVSAQNTLDVQKELGLPEDIIDAQFKSLDDDFDIKAAKTGALIDTTRVNSVIKNLKKVNWGPIVVDPVMVAKGGTRLLSTEAIQDVKKNLLPLSTIVTPNLPEAETLAGHSIKTDDEAIKAAQEIQKMGSKNVVIKGGHSNDQSNRDYVLLEDQHNFWLDGKHFDTNRKHGTGDTLSSVMVAKLAQGDSIEDSIRKAKQYINKIMEHPIIVGHGHGPLNHWGAGDFGNA